MWEIKLSVSYNVKEKIKEMIRRRKNSKRATHTEYELQKELKKESGKIKKRRGRKEVQWSDESYHIDSYEIWMKK